MNQTLVRIDYPRVEFACETKVKIMHDELATLPNTWHINHSCCHQENQR